MRCSEEPSRAPGRVAARRAVGRVRGSPIEATARHHARLLDRAVHLRAETFHRLAPRHRAGLLVGTLQGDESAADALEDGLDDRNPAKNALWESGSGVDASALEDVRSPISTSRSGAVGASCDFRGFGVREGGERGERWRVAGGEAERTRNEGRDDAPTTRWWKDASWTRAETGKRLQGNQKRIPACPKDGHTFTDARRSFMSPATVRGAASRAAVSALGMNNDRTRAPARSRRIFCLLGRATVCSLREQLVTRRTSRGGAQLGHRESSLASRRTTPPRTDGSHRTVPRLEWSVVDRRVAERHPRLLLPTRSASARRRC